MLNWEPGRKRMGSAHRCDSETKTQFAGAVDENQYSMLCSLEVSQVGEGRKGELFYPDTNNR